MKTRDYLKKITARKGKSFTQYGVWAAMKDYGWGQSTARNYMKETSLPSDIHCLDIAEVLEIDPAIVLADVTAERAAGQGSKAGEVWERIAKAMKNTAATFTVAVIMSAAILAPIGSKSIAYAFTSLDKPNQVIDIMRSWMGKIAAFFTVEPQPAGALLMA